MPYIFLWNPKKDPSSFKDFRRVQSNAKAGKALEETWICPSKQPQPGDAVVLQRTGSLNNGIFARGIVTRGAFVGAEGDQLVGLKLDAFLPIGKEIPRSEIIAAANYKKRWMPMASGNVLPESIYQAIQSLWAQRTEANGSATRTESQTDQDVRAEELVGLEGESLQRLITHRRRESRLRKRKIDSMLRVHGRLTCEVPGCGFDFQRIYGELGAGYAQVHHLKPLSKYAGPEETVLEALAVVCANCHAMIHRGGLSRDLGSLIPPARAAESESGRVR